jgi:hypothetical protein
MHVTGKQIAASMPLKQNNHDIIVASKYDLREHPTKYKQLGSKKAKQIREKIKNRTATKTEYKRLSWNVRLDKRRNLAVDTFWNEERRRIKRGQPATRNWSAKQREDILNKKRPKYKDKTMQSHHLYSVTKYPHLANVSTFIQPVTHCEHLYGYHGGSYRNSLPGKPIKNIKEF